MRNRKYLIGALVGVIGALALSGVANAAVTGQTLQTTLSPAKQDKKVFGGVSLHNIISTTIDNPATTQSPKTTVFTLDPNVKYVSGNIPACPLSAIQGKFDAQARAACPQSITGQGTVEVNNGAIKGIVTFFTGGPNTIYVQTDIGPGATTLTIIGTIARKTIDVLEHPEHAGPRPDQVRHHVQQAQVGQEVVLRDGPLQEGQVGDHRDHDLLQRRGLQRLFERQVQGDGVQEEEVGAQRTIPFPRRGRPPGRPLCFDQPDAAGAEPPVAPATASRSAASSPDRPPGAGRA